MISRQRDGLLLDVNPGFEAVTGYSRQEAVGYFTMELGLWADPADREAVRQAMEEWADVDPG